MERSMKADKALEGRHQHVEDRASFTIFYTAWETAATLAKRE